MKAEKIIALLDLTSLNHDDTDEKIIQLCHDAQTEIANVTAVCVYPKFVALAKKKLANTEIKIATVVNFPDGDQKISDVLKDIEKNITQGANEIDVVIPYRSLNNKNNELIREFVAQCKQVCGDVCLKTILETGELSASQISQASRNAISGGADFLKTSTGKVAINATLEATEIMLQAIKHSGKPVGLKVSGGVRTYEQAQEYIKQAISIMGASFITPNTFRIGASSLLNNLLTHVK